MSKIQDVMVVTGTYTVNGQEKKRYTKVGVAFHNEKGISIKLDKHFNPAGIAGECYLNLFDQKDKQQVSAEFDKAIKSEVNSLESDVPF